MKEVVTKLDAAGKPAGTTVHRYREQPIDVANLPAIVVYPAPSPQGVEETVEYVRIGGGRVRRKLNFRTELRIKTVDGTPATDTIDSLYTWVVKQLAPAGSLSSSGIVGGPHEVRSASEVFTEAETHVAVKVVEWEIEYQTLRTDPTEA